MDTDHHPIIGNITPSIDQLNHDRRLFQLPVVVCLAVIMVGAIFGNVLVLYVYVWKKTTPSSLFILLLAAGDLTSSCLCIPFQMFDLSNPYKYPVPVACKLFRFIETVANIWSGLVLLCIAVDRYMKICTPLRKYTLHEARSLAVVMIAMALALSWPQLFLVGKRTVETSVPGIFGEDCATQDGLYGSIYSVLFQGAISLAFALCFVVFVVFYVRIFHVIWKRKHSRIGERYSFRLSSDDKSPVNGTMPPEITTEQNNTAFSFDSLNGIPKELTTNETCATELKHFKQHFESLGFRPKANSVWSLCDMTPTNLLSRKSPRTPSTPSSIRSQTVKLSSQVKIRTSRTTVMLGLVTLAGVIGFTPYLIVEVLRQTGAAFRPGMTEAEDLLYEFCTKSYFLNNVVNPVIYSIMNPAFRRDSRAGLQRMFKC